jgi:hypothetical protein
MNSKSKIKSLEMEKPILLNKSLKQLSPIKAPIEIPPGSLKRTKNVSFAPGPSFAPSPPRPPLPLPSKSKEVEVQEEPIPDIITKKQLLQELTKVNGKEVDDKKEQNDEETEGEENKENQEEENKEADDDDGEDDGEDEAEEDEFPMITPTLAMFYQITNSKKSPFKDITGDILDIYYKSIRKLKLSYEEAIEATRDTESDLWDTKIHQLTYNLYADLMYLYRFYNGCSRDEPFVDIDFLIDIFKREALERQKGNITFVHSRNSMFKIMNSVISLVTNQDSLFVPKCKLKEKSPKKARQKYKEIYDHLPDNDPYSNNYTPDHIQFIRERLISVNLSLLNNIFNPGESSFLWFVDVQGNMGNIGSFLSQKIKNDALLMKLGDVVSEIHHIRKSKNNKNIGHTIMMISIPSQKLEDYVFSSNYGGRIDIKYKDVKEYLKIYLGKKLWGKDFSTIYSTQFRIMDLCYYKYGKNDGVEIFEFEQNSLSPIDIEFTIKQKFTPQELQELSIITDLPSEINEITQWPPNDRQSKQGRDLIPPFAPVSPMAPPISFNVPLPPPVSNVPLPADLPVELAAELAASPPLPRSKISPRPQALNDTPVRVPSNPPLRDSRRI